MESLSKDGEAVLFAIQTPKKGGLPNYLTIRLSPASQTLNATEFRAFALKELVKGASGVRPSEYKGIPLARYSLDNEPLTYTVGLSRVDTYPGGARVSRNLEAYFVQNEVWGRLTLRATSVDEEEEQQFRLLLDSVRFVDTSHPSTSFDYYHAGRLLYLQNQYGPAAEAFGAALKLEQQQPNLDTRTWRNLIVQAVKTQMALSRGSTAVEVLEYGVSKDPTNTTFLMQLARLYASLQNMDRTLATLEKAFFHLKQEKAVFEKKTSGRMSLPDLDRDPAFKDFMKIKKFRDAVKAMKE